MGNCTPIADLMVGTWSGGQFWVDVKGLSSKNSWNLTPKRDFDHLYYILVYFAPVDAKKRDRFFILTQSEANELVREYQKKASHSGDTGKAPGFAFKDPEKFEDAWKNLPIALGPKTN
jgi:hypothetical protein